MSGDWDLVVKPAENGYQVSLDRWGKDLPTVRFNAATKEDVVEWIALKLAAEEEPKP